MEFQDDAGSVHGDGTVGGELAVGDDERPLLLLVEELERPLHGGFADDVRAEAVIVQCFFFFFSFSFHTNI